MYELDNEAIKIGVVSYKTAKKLDWQHETYFCYAQVDSISSKVKEKQTVLMRTEDANTCGYDIVYAPQMHDIFAHMPLCILIPADDKSTGKSSVFEFYLMESNVYYISDMMFNHSKIADKFEKQCNTPVKNKNFVEAIATLYMLVRKLGLLELNEYTNNDI